MLKTKAAFLIVLSVAALSAQTITGSITGTLWIDTNLAFPAATVLDKQITLPEQTNTRRQGTNNIVTKTPPKIVQQNVVITLLDTALITPANVETTASSP